MPETVTLAPTSATTSARRPSNLSAILTIAQRDVTKLLSDRPRLVGSFVLPFLMVVILGRSFQGLTGVAHFDYVTFVFTGVYAQTVFQSAATGLVSLLDDRDNDFSQELFVAPVSRYAIVSGKILGESLVAIVQAAGVVVFGFIIGADIPLHALPGLALVTVVMCLVGGAFGLLLLAPARNRRFAEQIFNFVFLPQFLLAGVFNPIGALPTYLDLLSRLAPLRYAVDLTRSVFYIGSPDRDDVVVDGLAVDSVVMALLFVVCVAAGTALFVRKERDR